VQCHELDYYGTTAIALSLFSTLIPHHLSTQSCAQAPACVIFCSPTTFNTCPVPSYVTALPGTAAPFSVTFPGTLPTPSTVTFASAFVSAYSPLPLAYNALPATVKSTNSVFSCTRLSPSSTYSVPVADPSMSSAAIRDQEEFRHAAVVRRGSC